jgi:putative transposase
MNPDGEGHPQGGAPTLSLPDVVHRFKTMMTKRYADGVKHADWQRFPGRLWQRNNWEHIIRDESELNGIREYIACNPAGWETDGLNDAGTSGGTSPKAVWMV